MNENKTIALIFAAFLGIAFIGMTETADAGVQRLGNEHTIYKSTAVAVSQTTNVVSGVSVFGCVHVTSAVATSSFIIYDSSNTTVADREVFGNFSGAAVGTWCFDIATDLGITYVSTNDPKFTLTYISGN